MVRADSSYRPRVERPAFAAPGPVVLFDEGHRNVHRLATNYRPFARLLEADGLAPQPIRGPFTRSSLAGAALLVIVNAKGPRGHDPKSAFEVPEIDAIARWVEAGGGLLLVADHTPFGAAAGELARRFGVEMLDGEVQDPDHADRTSTDPAQLVFDREGGLLGEHPILDGRDFGERVGRVVTFTGQALAAPPQATRLLALSPSALDLPVLEIEMIETTFGWDRRTTFGDLIPTRGNCQVAALEYGAGRVVVVGEAALLTAQRRGESRFGMQAPAGTDNEQFALNTMRWLGGRLGTSEGGLR
jgi:hypothetical protein